MVEVVINQNDGFVSITAVGGETDLDFDFPIYEKSHLTIKRTRSGTTTTLALNTDYTIANGELEVTAGGTAVLVTPATAGDVYTLLLDVPEARSTDFTQAGDFLTATLNRELDLFTQMQQQIRRDVDKSIRLPDTSTLSSISLDDLEGNRGFFLKVNDDEDGFDYAGSTTLGGVTVTAFAQTFLDDTSAGSVRSTLDAEQKANSLTTVTAVAADSVVIADASDSGNSKKALISDITALAGVQSDSNFRIQDNSDATKQIAFEASGISTGTTRTFTAPNASGTLLLAYTPITASLGADVNLNNTSNYFDGPSVAQGSTGTWFASGTVTLNDSTAGSGGFHAKLWDGTTVVASTSVTTTGSGEIATVSLSGYLASPAGNLRISVRSHVNTAGKILFNQSGNSKDSTISAFRIA